MKKMQFLLPPEQIYMCGHSLGPMPILAKRCVQDTLQAWENDAVKAWNTQAWIDLSYQVAAKIAPLIGAAASDVVMSASTSVNLFKVVMSALRINKERHVILTIDDDFPADLYIAQGIHALNTNLTIQMVEPDALLSSLTEEVAVLVLSHINYRDARVYDMAQITKAAHEKGILTVWDLSHSVGAIPLHLAASEVDFAVGCTYKYLNGGPGAPAFIYVHAQHQMHRTNPIYGWMGHVHPFTFDTQYETHGIAQYLSGTPYILSLKALDGALDVFEDIDNIALHALSLAHSSTLMSALDALNLEVITPRTLARGGHVAFLHPEGYALSRALIDHGVTVDYREQGLIRLCVNPLYLDESDINTGVARLRHVLETGLYRAPQYQQKLKVT